MANDKAITPAVFLARLHVIKTEAQDLLDEAIEHDPSIEWVVASAWLAATVQLLQKQVEAGAPEPTAEVAL